MADPRTDLLQGTLDALILRTLSQGENHGWGIAQRIQQVSEDVLQVGQGSLYPALYRLEEDGLIAAEWGQSENNRRAKFYRLTRAGRERLAADTASWERLSAAVDRVLGLA
ncbi:MAG: PadR family transcriptional regulator [Vicinamibacteria bacterium]|nr:PadR family transcriptional regulator [Vicinamibacteria bacterium]